jgi:diaminohydroxyphosphoribosylaminopyrimidine deaminase/5-amino-6-(5-phosphoribosylamino)uracil reductase
MVGCLFVKNGLIVSEGYHKKFGDSHAEINAHNSLPIDIDPKTCDVYVSLEPCSHHGNTPPCVDLLIRLKPNRVIIGCMDPNPKVAGTGIKLLKEAGIAVVTGILESECRSLNKHFFKAHQTNLPYVTLKWAQTKDQFMARKITSHESQKISDLRNDSFVHQLRAKHQAILVGANTINVDDPLLDVRYSDGNNPIKVILSPNLSVNQSKQVFKNGQSIIYNKTTTIEMDNYELKQINPFSLKDILNDLYNRGLQSVLVEGGIQVLQSFLDSDLWDEAVILESENSWSDGQKAPMINHEPKIIRQSYNDTISYYKI